MKTSPAVPDGQLRRPYKVHNRRKPRPRPTPKWLLHSNELEATPRSRCLMVLSVLSGEKPVTEAILEAKISRNTYYKLETRALQAILAAMRPRSLKRSSHKAELAAATSRIRQLLMRVERLEQEKRRLQRLLLLARKSIHPQAARTANRGFGAKPRRTLGPSCFERSTMSPPPSDAPSSSPPGVPSP